MREKKDKTECQDLLFHLTIMGVFLFVILSSCSVSHFLTNRDQTDNTGTLRYNITKKDLTQFASALRHRERDPDKLYQQALYFQRNKKHKLALEVLEELIFTDPSDPSFFKAYNAMGVSYDFIGDHIRAIEAYKRALRLNPDLAYVQNNLGYSFLLQGNLDEAIVAFQKAVSLDYRNHRYHNNLGLAYGKSGQFDKAFFEFTLAGTNAKAHYNMAKVYFQQGLYNEARIHFAKASTLKPSMGGAKKGLEASEALAWIAKPGGSQEHKDKPAQKPYRVGLDKDGKQQNFYTIPAPETKVAKKKNPYNVNPLRSVPSERIQAQRKVPKQKFSNSEQGLSQAIQKKHMMAFVTQKDTNVSSGAQAQGLVLKRTIPRTKKTLPPEFLPRKFTSAEKRADLMTVDQPNAIKQRNFLKMIDIEISNGNGVNRMAGGVGSYLKNRGHNVTRLTNADHFKYKDTMIYYRRGYLHDAYRVAQEIPRYQRMKKVNNFDRQNIKIKVLLGQDVVPYRKSFKREDAGS